MQLSILMSFFIQLIMDGSLAPPVTDTDPLIKDIITVLCYSISSIEIRPLPLVHQ